MPRYKNKPLLAEQGILHLDNCFLPPTTESGLLTTVGGGEESALVLAPNYGYGILASQLNTPSPEEKADEQSPQDFHPSEKRRSKKRSNTAQELQEAVDNSPKRSCVEERNSAQEEADQERDDDSLSVAHLVRAIGGAKNKPIRTCDVVDDQEKMKPVSVPEEDPEAEEFYASLGMSKNLDKTNTDSQLSDDIVVVTDPQNTEQDKTENVTQSVAAFYKDYCNYYYSVEPDPFGEDRLEFGQALEGKQPLETIDSSVIELARAAQKARRTMEAAMLAKRVADERAKLIPVEEESFDPLPTEVVPSDTAHKLGITSDTSGERYWELVKQDPHDFNRWTYLLQHVEHSVRKL